VAGKPGSISSCLVGVGAAALLASCRCSSRTQGFRMRPLPATPPPSPTTHCPLPPSLMYIQVWQGVLARPQV
jgi:hypothetical protein